MEYFYIREFWKIKIRNKSTNDLIDILKINNITDEYIPSRVSNKIIKELLFSYNNKKDGKYDAFWTGLFTATNNRKQTYFLILSLFFLSIENKDNFEKNLLEINSIFDINSLTNKKISDFLKFYFRLLTIICIECLFQIYELDSEQKDHFEKDYKESYIDEYVYKFIGDEIDNISNIKFFVNKLSILSDDVLIRDNILLIKKNYELNETSFEIPKNIKNI